VIVAVGLAVVAGCGLPPAARRGLLVDASSRAGSDGEPRAASASTVGSAHLRELQAHPAVVERVAWMLGRGRRTLRTSLMRGLEFVPMIEREFGERGVPAELAYLPVVESCFLPDATGRSAVGLWQFTRSTARKYGLTVDRRIDERRDPAKSTRAAARYLRDLYDQFQSWDLALAAYNAGPGRVRRALRRKPRAGFFELAEGRLLPPITRRYVPKVLAVSVIGPRPESYGVELARKPRPVARPRLDDTRI